MNMHIQQETRLDRLITSTIKSLNAVKNEPNLRLKGIELRAARTKIDIIVECLEESTIDKQVKKRGKKLMT